MKKRLLSLIIAVALLFSLAACGGNTTEMPKKSLPDYPILTENEGYSVSGRVTDEDGNGLYNAQITVNGDVKALSDKNGDYTVTELIGESAIGVSFYDYVFRKTAYVVNNSSTGIDFVGSSNFTVSASSYTINNAQLFGVTYAIGNQVKGENNEGLAYALNNKGRTTITPRKAGFTFYPQSADLYTSGHVQFTAVPDDDTFTVSGTLNFSSTSELPEVFIYVNGVKYTQSVVSVSNNTRKATYVLYGLTHTDNSYAIWAGSGPEGYKSANNFVINSERTGVNFDMIKCLNVSVNLVFPSTDDISGSYSYYVKIIDENGDEIDRQKITDRKTSDNYDVWAGCKIIVEAIGGAFTTEREVITSTYIDNNLKEIDIQCRVA